LITKEGSQERKPPQTDKHSMAWDVGAHKIGAESNRKKGTKEDGEANLVVVGDPRKKKGLLTTVEEGSYNVLSHISSKNENKNNDGRKSRLLGGECERQNLFQKKLGKKQVTGKRTKRGRK